VRVPGFSAALLLAAALVAGAGGCARAVTPAELARISLPPGFSISIYGEVPGARSMAWAPEISTLFVGTRGDTLYAVRDRDGDERAETARVVGRGFNVPNGIAWHDGWLYVAEQNRVIRWRPMEDAPEPRDVQVLFDDLPDRSHHGWRYATVGPDRRLYVAVGAPCNICAVSGLEGTIVRMNLDGSGVEIFARGIRNSVGIDFRPNDGLLYFTDNGGDGLGNDVPPDEFNRADRAGLHFGYPHYAGGRAVSPGWAGRTPPPGAVFPAVSFGAHVAALGVHFYRGGLFPVAYRNDAFVAQHGSWNRTVPDGYRVMRVRFDAAGRPLRAEPFATGWLGANGATWGRPVDVKELPDGALLVSDDHAGVIYRIDYRIP